MFTTRFRTATRTVTVGLALGVLASSTLMASGGNAAGQDPKYRKVAPPNVMFPVPGGKSVKDLKSFSSRNRGTDIQTACSRPVLAAHPGVAEVLTNPRNHHKYVVRVASNGRGLVTTAGHLTSAAVTDGQIVQSGQRIGTTGRRSADNPCGIYFAVKNAGHVLNPSTWLNTWVGKAPPVPKLFGTTGFNVASFNLLGASHTVRSSRFATYKPRLDRAVRLMNSYKLDVVGTQEFQETTQFDYFRAKGYTKTWGAHYWNPAGQEARHRERHHLAQVEDGVRQGLHVRHPLLQRQHPPCADRTAAREVERAHGVLPERAQPRRRAWAAAATGVPRRSGSSAPRSSSCARPAVPVFITGDFNDREKAFCPMTAGKLTISPNSIPSDDVRLPEADLDRLDLRRRPGPLLVTSCATSTRSCQHQRPPGRPGASTPAELITTAQ